MDSRTTVGCKWWGLAIALAVEGGDVGSRARLAKATGDPEAWTAFAAIDMGKAGMAAGLGEFLLTWPRTPTTWTLPGRVPASRAMTHWPAGQPSSAPG